MTKDCRAVVRKLVAQGFEVRTTKKGHISVRKDGTVVAVLAGTPSDWRSHRNGLSQLRRAGFSA